jgi:hypothetical protein
MGIGVTFYVYRKPTLRMSRNAAVSVLILVDHCYLNFRVRYPKIRPVRVYDSHDYG